MIRLNIIHYTKLILILIQSHYLSHEGFSPGSTILARHCVHVDGLPTDLTQSLIHLRQKTWPHLVFTSCLMSLPRMVRSFGSEREELVDADALRRHVDGVAARPDRREVHEATSSFLNSVKSEYDCMQTPQMASESFKTGTSSSRNSMTSALRSKRRYFEFFMMRTQGSGSTTPSRPPFISNSART